MTTSTPTEQKSKSYSRYTEEDLLEMGIDVVELSNPRRRVPADQIIEVIKVDQIKDYAKMAATIHLFYDMFIDVMGNPTWTKMAASTKTRFVTGVLVPVLYFFKKNSKFARDHNLQLNTEHQMGRRMESGGLMDYMLKLDGQARKDLVVIEVKKVVVVDAFVQCVLAMLQMYRNNGNTRNVYGICTNSVSWCILVYNGSKFEASKDYSILEDKNKLGDLELWNRKNGKLVQTLYSLVAQAVKSVETDGGGIASSSVQIGEPSEEVTLESVNGKLDQLIKLV